MHKHGKEALDSAYKKGDKFKNLRQKYPECRHIRVMDYSNMTSFGMFRPKVFKFILFFIGTFKSFIVKNTPIRAQGTLKQGVGSLVIPQPNKLLKSKLKMM